MCQLLGLNSNVPTDIVFSFEGFRRRGGLTGEHIDGWGIAFFEDKASRVLLDPLPSAHSAMAEWVRQHPIKSRHIIAHIRKATRGSVRLANTHPFQRELWGQSWVFARNGDLQNLPSLAGERFQAIGDTDSEHAFCWLLNQLAAQFRHAPAVELLDQRLVELLQALHQHGTCNILLSQGERLYAHCSTHLHWIVRAAPFHRAHLADADLSIDFSSVTGEEDRVAIIATEPLTDDEVWQIFTPGETRVFCAGESTRLGIASAR